MELETQTQASNHSSVYMTAPTSPNAYSRSSSMEFYYSGPASPGRKPCIATIDDVAQKPINGSRSNFDDFEFETSKKFSGELNFLTSQNSESEVNVDDQGHDVKLKYRARGDSLPAMAFADELFLNGLVMPLKLPPRLQYDSDSNSFSQKSPVLSPRTPRTVCRIPFAHKSSWNDDFDPFLVAMEKVREEKRGRNSHHRRSRSYSPFRAMPNCSNDYIDSCNQDFSKADSPIQPMQVTKPSHSGPLDFKGSAYARWVRDQTKEGGLSQREPKSARGFLFGQRVRPVKTEQDDADKPGSNGGERVKEKCGNVKEESKVQKLKGFLLRYASFGREKTSSEECKASYFSKLSFKFKGKGHSNGKKKMNGDTKMAVVQYKPSFTSCIGYGAGSPAKVK